MPLGQPGKALGVGRFASRKTCRGFGSDESSSAQGSLMSLWFRELCSPPVGTAAQRAGSHGQVGRVGCRERVPGSLSSREVEQV